MDDKSTLPVLVADIGGTHARFALAALDREGHPVLTSVRQFDVLQFASLGHAAAHYLGQTGLPKPRRSLIAVASAIAGDEITLTNNPWSFSIVALQRELGLDEVRVINDFAAVAMAVPHLAQPQLKRIGEAVAPAQGRGADRRYAVLGPGTGLGVCGLLLREGRAVVIDSEGGHVGFAPDGDYEIAILRFLMKRYARVSVERILSGPGLQNLYAAVCAVEGVAGSAQEPEQITAAALRGTDAACGRAVELFCSILGSFAGDVALMVGAWDGVYLGGGMTATLLPWICRGDLRQRFLDKGRFQWLMQTIPTFAITHPQPGLLGAGAWATAVN